MIAGSRSRGGRSWLRTCPSEDMHIACDACGALVSSIKFATEKLRMVKSRKTRDKWERIHSLCRKLEIDLRRDAGDPEPERSVQLAPSDGGGGRKPQAKTMDDTLPGAAAATPCSAEPPVREGLLDLLELVSRQRPDLLRLVLEAVNGSPLRRVVASLAEELGVAEPRRLLEKLWQSAAAVSLLERNWPSRKQVLRDPPSPLLAAVCEARRRNVDGRRRVRLTLIERKLRAEMGACASTGEEGSES